MWGRDGGRGGSEERREDTRCGEGKGGEGRVVFIKEKTAKEIEKRDWSADVCSSDSGWR